MRNFEYICHLGESTSRDDQDQRLAVRGEDDGLEYFLFDWSGVSPDTTCDGPLRIDVEKPIKVGAKISSVAVTSKHGTDTYCGVQTRNLWRLLEQVELKIEFESDLDPILQLLLRSVGR